MSTNDSYWFEHNWQVLPSITEIVAHLAIKWIPSFCTPIPSVDITLLFRLRRRVQLYCSRSRYTRLSMLWTHKEVYSGWKFIHRRMFKISYLLMFFFYLFFLGQVDVIERNFTWYLYIKYPFTQPNLLLSF